LHPQVGHQVLNPDFQHFTTEMAGCGVTAGGVKDVHTLDVSQVSVAFTAVLKAAGHDHTRSTKDEPHRAPKLIPEGFNILERGFARSQM